MPRQKRILTFEAEIPHMPTQRGAVRSSLTDQQERFCRGLAVGLPLIDAYKEAGYNLGKGNNNPAAVRIRAASLAGQPKLQRRIGQLEAATGPAVEKALANAAGAMAVDLVERRAWVHRQLETIAVRATNTERYGDALDALRMIGEDIGMGWATPGGSTAGRQAARIGAAAGVAAGAAMSTGILDQLRAARDQQFGTTINGTAADVTDQPAIGHAPAPGGEGHD